MFLKEHNAFDSYYELTQYSFICENEMKTSVFFKPGVNTFLSSGELTDKLETHFIIVWKIHQLWKVNFA